MIALLLAVIAAAAPPPFQYSHSAGVHVLTVRDPARLAVFTGHDRVPGLERPSAMSKRHHALAGVNGGYFAVAAPDAGDPTGVLVADGEPLSEPVGARTALIVNDGKARVGRVRWHARLTIAGGSRIIDGVDRNRGRIPACGGVGGDAPTQAIDPALTCTDPSELVVLTPAYSGRVPASGVHVKLGDDVLTGSGDAARFLRRPGRQHIDWGTDDDLVIGGAPRLLRNGRVHVTAAQEGRGTDTAPRPRTVAGVKADGSVLLIAIDGATLTEAARIAKRLGARDALSFDSGGSTAMVVGKRTVLGGQRAVADGLFVTSRSR